MDGGSPMNKEIFIVLGNKVALLLALGILYDTIAFSKNRQTRPLQILNGVIIGTIGIILMLTPLQPLPGINIDTRSILMSISGLFFGFLPTLVAVLFTSGFRLYLGGLGVWTGIAMIVATAGVGLARRYFMTKKLSEISILDLYKLGIVTHLVMLLLAYTFPPSISHKIANDTSLPIVLIFPLATVLLGKIMVHQLKRREMEAALKKSESLHKSIFENHHQVMLLIDPGQGHIVDANPAACDFYGWSREELKKMNISHINTLPPKSILQEMQKAHSEQRNYFFFKHRLADNTIKDVEVYSGPIKIRGQTLLYSIINDISIRKQVEESLIAEKELLAVTLGSIGDGVITTDTQGAVVMMNKVAEDLSGWRIEEAKRHPQNEIFRVIDVYTRKPSENLVEKVLSTNAIVEFENCTLLISRNNREMLISSRGAPIHDKDHNIIGTVLIFRDVTERQKLIEAVQRTEKLNSLGILAGGIAHDFNNLLSGIFGYIDMARLKSTGDETVVHYLNASLEVNNRARDLTQQLLTFAKGGEPTRRMIPLGPFLKKNVEFALCGSKIECHFDIADDLGPCEFDEHQMAQVVNNIIINAQQAMPAGGDILVSAADIESPENTHLKRNTGKYCRITISDNGPGIPPNMLSRIFDPFFSTKEKGSGLGLTICHSIVEKHGGFIDIDSPPGKGTTFHVYLPVSAQTTDHRLPSSAEPPIVRHQGQGRILVMDDENTIRDIVATMLQTMGYTVTEVKDGHEAIKAFSQINKNAAGFKAVILDLTVRGGMGGLETVAEIRKIAPFIPIFASSGYSDNPIMSRPSRYGFTDCLQKPYTFGELAALLNRHLSPETNTPAADEPAGKSRDTL